LLSIFRGVAKPRIAWRFGRQDRQFSRKGRDGHPALKAQH
jgi:hypothetical protein